MPNELLQQFAGGLFPRSGGGGKTPYRCDVNHNYYIFNSVEDIEHFIIDHNETDCYCSIYSYTEYNQNIQNKLSAIIDVIPIDLDNEDLSIAYEELKVLLAWCKRHQIEPMVQFSGAKGFHLYINVNPIILKNPQYVLHRFAEELIEAGNFTCIDIRVTGDLARIMRLPNTINSKSGRYCIPINPKLIPLLTIEDIIELSKEKSDYIYVRKPLPSDSEIHKKLFELDEKKEIDIVEHPKSKYDGLFPRLRYNIYCQAYEDSINGVNTNKVSRDDICVGIVCYLRSRGLSKDDAFKKVLEFGMKCNPPLSYGYVQYKVNYHYAHNLKWCTMFVNHCECCKTCRNRTF